MVSNPKRTEKGMLEQWRVAFENVRSQPTISTIMADFGFDEPTIAQGEALYNQARMAYDTNKVEDDETLEVKNQLDDAKRNQDKIYRRHRRKAKVVFRYDPVSFSEMALEGDIPDDYLGWLETMRKFYTTALASPTIQEKLARLKVTSEELTGSSTNITAIEGLRASYLREIGESQDATQVKDKALLDASIWMRDFYAVAKIALEDQPQLLEALGLPVRS